MPNVDVRQKSIELRQLISEYDIESFVGFFALILRQKFQFESLEVLEHFKSRQKDFLYLIALKIFSHKDGNEKFVYNTSILLDIANRINEIKDAYTLNDFSTERFFNDISYQEKSIIHEFTFNNYFHNGALTYVEQDIALFRSTFQPYENIIIEEFGLDIQFLIDMYVFAEDSCRQKYYERLFNEFSEIMLEERNAELDFDYSFLKIDLSEYYSKFPKSKINSFLKLFSCKHNDQIDFLYYSENNPIDLKPILQIEDTEYLFT